MPTNLYGPGDYFDLQKSHVIPALMRKFHEAKMQGRLVVDVWGTGNPRREFLHVDDMAEACVFLMELDAETFRRNAEPMLSHINVGVGEDVSIRELAETMREVTGFASEIRFDASKPDGTPRKLLDVSRISSMGWNHRIGLRQGLQQTYDWFLAHEDEIRS